MTPEGSDRTKPGSAIPRRVAVLMGGPDAEHEVSLNSGSQVVAALERAGFEVRAEVVDRPSVAWLRELDAEVVFPVLHGPFGEGGPLQERLEEAGLAYVGSGPEASRLGMDKLASKAAVAAAGVPTPDAERLLPGLPSRIEPPAVVKPVADGSSVGVRLCRTPAEFLAARTSLEPVHAALMAERLIEGRELTIGLIAGEVLPIIEIVPAEGFYDYQAKYLRNDTRYVIDPPLDAAVAEAMRRHARAAWIAIGCRDLARIDFLLDAEGPWFLEVNTMPGMTDHSLVPKAAAEVGLPMEALCRLLVDQAAARSHAAGLQVQPAPLGGR